jgi:hypothetical protein
MHVHYRANFLIATLRKVRFETGNPTKKNKKLGVVTKPNPRI